MEITEVVETAHEVHARQQCFGTVNQGARPAHQIVHALTEGSVEPFDKSGIDDALALSGFDQAFHPGGVTLGKAPFNGQNACEPLLNDLDNGNVRPGHHLASTDFACPVRKFATKGLAKSRHLTGQTIDRQQQRPTPGYGPDFVHQGLDQIQISLWADHAAQPQSRRDG